MSSALEKYMNAVNTILHDYYQHDWKQAKYLRLNNLTTDTMVVIKVG